MIIDCHGHYTTAPNELGDYRDAQKAELEKAPLAVGSKGLLNVSDQQIRDCLAGAQLKLQAERGTDLTIFSPRASWMGHHIGNEHTSRFWTEHCNELIHRITDIYPTNFVGVALLPQSPGVGMDISIHEMLKHIRKIKESYEAGYQLELRLGGIPMIADDMISYVKSDLVNFGFGVFVFIVITLKLIFRKTKWIILPLFSCAYAVLTMIGLLGFFGWKVTVISSNFISLMLILTLSMNIHLIVRYRQLCAQSNNNQMETVDEMTSKMVRPCLYTALTTIVAFASLVFSDIKPVIDFGYMMILGLSVTFITSFLLLPSILLSLIHI